MEASAVTFIASYFRFWKSRREQRELSLFDEADKDKKVLK